MEESVLVVDDEPAVCELFRKVLTEAGYRVTKASDGEEALSLLEAGAFDLAVVDLVMPGQEGVETIVSMRKSTPGLKIVAVSGVLGDDFMRVVKLLGADTTLAKPVEPHLLVRTVREVLGGRTALGGLSGPT